MLQTKLILTATVRSGRGPRVARPASIGVKLTSVADSHAVARAMLTRMGGAARKLKVPNSQPHAQRSISMLRNRSYVRITNADETSAAF